MPLPTIAQGAPFVYIISTDASGNSTGLAYTADGVAYALVPEVGIGINSGTGVNRLLAPVAQGLTNNNGSNMIPIAPFLLNGTSFDAQISNTDGITVQTLTAQAAGTVVSTTQKNINARGLMLGINITAVTGSLTVTVQGVDPVSGGTFTLLVSAALAAVAKTLLMIYPGATTSANVVASQPLPRSWNVSSLVTTGPVSAVISASLIV